MQAWTTTAPADAAQQLSTELERLPGVLAAAVWLEAQRGVTRVRLHTHTHASATVIAHAATRVLEQRGYALDPSLLQVIPSATLGENAGSGGGGRFLVLHDVTWNREGSRVHCRVRLARDTDLLQGEAAELDTEMGRARAAAAATLHAAERTVEGLALGLEGIAVVALFGRRYMAVSVEAAVSRRFAQLSGLVAVDASRTLEEAAALATLRAIERWIAV